MAISGTGMYRISRKKPGFGVCLLCHTPDSCAYIARECPDHAALRINRHNADCKLVHAAFRKIAKEGGALHSAPDLLLVSGDTDLYSQTLDETPMSLSSTPEGDNTDPKAVTTTLN